MRMCKLGALLVGVVLVSIVGGARHSEEDAAETGDSEMSGSGRIMAVLGPESTSFGVLDGSKSSGLLNGPPFSASFQGGAKGGQYYGLQGSSFNDGGTRSGKQMGNNALSSALSSLSPQALLALSASGSNYGYLTEPLAASDFGEHAAASGSSYGGGQSGHPVDHHSLLHSHFGKFSFGKPDCNSALGLLGVLGLVSFLQNVLRQMTSTTLKPLIGRKKRSSGDLGVTEELRGLKEEVEGKDGASEVIGWTLPLLTAAAHVKDGLIPLECAYLDICSVNRKLVKEMGSKGRSIGFSVTKAVQNLLEGSKSLKWEESKIVEAGRIGRGTWTREGGSCERRFHRCRQLELLPSYTIPMSMLGPRSE